MYGLGYRPAVIQRIELGASADGTLDAIAHEAITVTSQYEDFHRQETGWSGLALAEQLQAGAVEHEVDGAIVPRSARLATGEPATTPGQGRMVGNSQPEPEQLQQAAGERLGLTKREVEDEPQGQHQLDRQVRVERLPTGCRPTRGPPSRQHRLVEPESYIPALLQTGLVGRPVRHPVARLGNA
jgi:hypothetical protein